MAVTEKSRREGEQSADEYTLLDFADEMAEIADEYLDPVELERAIEAADERHRAELDEHLP